jgi:hypothetical protein
MSVTEAGAVSFELDRFELVEDERLEVGGRWYGVRGRRFVRPSLTARGVGEGHRSLALLDHKPWAASDGTPWVAAFRWDRDPAELTEAELAVAPDIAVCLPAPSPRGASAVRRRAPKQSSTRLQALRDDANRALDAERRAETSRLRGELARVHAELEPLRGELERQRAAQIQATSALARRDAALAKLAEVNAERDAALRVQRETVAERDALRRERDSARAERDAARAERNRRTAERDGLWDELSSLQRGRPSDETASLAGAAFARRPPARRNAASWAARGLALLALLVIVAVVVAILSSR